MEKFHYQYWDAKIKISQMLKVVKTILFTLLLLLIDNSTTYLIEQSNLIDVKPLTIPLFESNFHSITTAFLWNLVFIGWTYYIMVIVARRVVSRLGPKNRKFLTVTIYYLSFLLLKVLHQVFDVRFKVDLLYSSLIVGIFISVFWFWAK